MVSSEAKPGNEITREPIGLTIKPGDEREVVGCMFMIVQAPQITQATVIAIIISATIVVVALLALIGYFASRTPENQEGGRSTSETSLSWPWGS